MQNFLLTVMVLVIGYQLSISANYFSYVQETSRVSSSFKVSAGQHTFVFGEKISSALEMLHGLGGLWSALPQVSRQHFVRHAQIDMKRHPSFTALEWIARVPHAAEV